MRPLLRNDESAYGAVQLATSADYYFGADSIALRATFRFGAKIARQVRAKGNTKVGRRAKSLRSAQAEARRVAT